MIISYTKRSKTYQFCKPSADYKNVFTIIVGKNGSGKSRLLNDIISNFIPSHLAKKISTAKDGFLMRSSEPTKVLAVSTSPYDKFPLTRSLFGLKFPEGNYSYIGIREIRSSDFSLGFISKIIKELLHVRLSNPEQFHKIIDVLGYLGYNGELQVKFETVISSAQIRRFLESRKTEDDFRHIFFKNNTARINTGFFETGEKLDFVKLEYLQKIFMSYEFSKYMRSPTVTINADSIELQMDLEDLLFILEAGLLRLKDVYIRKIENNRIYPINEASSGEQCIFNTFIGIACKIADNSLIVIDEPEISLHPAWQERYITLLMDTFQHYKGCHFIIATHSPQLVSKLSNENCYVLKMDDGELMDGELIANNSADFQLANVFNTPGFKNEYLGRIAFSIISKVGKTNKFDSEDLENFTIIQSQIKNMQHNDPIRKLFDLIKDLKRNA
ncbi:MULTISPECIES: ATP-binding protein [Chryseobacterium]|uniref:AAA domain-containing protein, putative AbiEii toxin, Type IV TA system n=1 Tax=Chryseobacterium wanjuense TaxID=356305 RepID=A0A1I0R0C0_9FLAO|nr:MULTISPECIES: ATP-binding protein [Chryseobacterium]KYH08260.1 hypothetical protein A1704_06295 [Chryseobacterium cucumeris]SEW33516.1 AAA domain-containing protein, putative AbiEii toxin, Type IV TA system [Chryseobacterium wanjuense]